MNKTFQTVKKPNKCLYTAGMFLLVVFILMISPLTVSAKNEKCSLTLRCVYSVEGGKRVLSDDEYSMVKIADAELTEDAAVYSTLKAFRSFDCDWPNTAASELDDIAEELSHFCKENRLFTSSALTDTKGELTFNDLAPGLYLVSRTKTASSNEEFITDSLLVFIPEMINGEIIYDVVSTPKFSYDPPDEPLPQTGQLLWPVTVFSVLGAVLIICGIFLFRKEDKGEK